MYVSFYYVIYILLFAFFFGVILYGILKGKQMITNPLQLNLTEDQINNSLFQQVMSKFTPDKFSLYKELDTFIPRSQLEKLVVANLKKHKIKSDETNTGKSTGRKITNSKKYLTEEK